MEFALYIILDANNPLIIAILYVVYSMYVVNRGSIIPCLPGKL